MDMIRWLMRAKRWAQNPPSMSRVLLVLGVVGVCLVLFAIERVWCWPDWLTVEAIRRPLR